MSFGLTAVSMEYVGLSELIPKHVFAIPLRPKHLQRLWTAMVMQIMRMHLIIFQIKIDWEQQQEEGWAFINQIVSNSAHFADALNQINVKNYKL